MKISQLSAALAVGGMLVAAPAFAQTTTTQKQKTQEVPSMPGPTGGNFNGDPNYKQRTQEVPSMPGPVGGNFNGDPNYKQRTQSLSHADPSQDAVKQKP